MKKLLFWGPVLTASGYGEHARQLLKSILLYGSEEFDVSVCSVGWGKTPMISDSDYFTLKTKQLVEKFEEEKSSGIVFDVCIQVTIPNEFKRMAKFMIGVTAGIEVDRVSPEWIVKTNENVDILVVPSKHSAETFASVVYKDEAGNELKLQKDIVIIPEGVDTRFFNSLKEEKSFDLNVDTEFNFLSVGLGLDKQFGEDRKNISTLVKYFCETFKDDPRVGLILKTSIVNNSLMDFEITKSRIEQIKSSVGCGKFPRIYLVHGRLSKQELSSLYKHPKVKAYITLTHGEGFGLPVIEAAACAKPVLATNWSGHLDFLSIEGKKRFVDLNYELKEIPKSCVWKGVMEEGTKWAVVDEQDVKIKMKKVMLSVEKPTEWAQELSTFVTLNFDESKIGHNFFKFVKASCDKNIDDSIITF